MMTGELQFSHKNKGTKLFKQNNKLKLTTMVVDRPYFSLTVPRSQYDVYLQTS
jgi:hypothetical protein